MKKYLGFLIVLIVGCSELPKELPIAKEFDFTFWDHQKADSVFCIQVNSELITPNNALSYSFVKHELVDTTSAFIKLYGRIIKVSNSSNTITISSDNDTIEGRLPFILESPSAFIGLETVVDGKIKIHPKLKFDVQSLLVLGIKKAPESSEAL